MEKIVEITDGVILIRQPVKTDIPEIYTAIRESLPELHPWLDWATDAYSMSSAGEWFKHVDLAWERSSSFHFCIVEVGKGLAGVCQVSDINQREGSCNIGYWVRSSRSRLGFASRAVRLAANFAFTSLGLQQARISMASANIASQRVAQKAGAHYSNTSPLSMVVRTELHDGILYLLTPSDLSQHAKN